MTHPPDDPNDPADGGPSGRDEGAGRKLDEDAAWADIVAHYGDRADVPEDPEKPATPPPSPPSPESQHERLQGLFKPAWTEASQSEATWHDEGHFVPPTPPPLPPMEPRRRMAWGGLFGAPALMLLSVVLGWQLPGIVSAALAAAFVGGFVYLVATMPNRRGDGSGDNGAVV